MTSALRLLSEHACFGGLQCFFEHASEATGTPMRFGIYLPPQAAKGPCPAVIYLAGLTCTEETFAIKAGAQREAARLGLVLVSPDTSPRGTSIEGADSAWDFGHGAGFYLDATEAPWSAHFRMERYITQELHELLCKLLPVRADAIGLMGHSMGGHGALTLALRHPGQYRSVSALAPIVAPSQVPWGRKAFMGYLGADEAAWAAHDACALIAAGGRLPPLLVDQGLADKFLAEQLQPERLEAVCQTAGQDLTLRRHRAYDHGYYFVASVIADHLQHHAVSLSSLAAQG